MADVGVLKRLEQVERRIEQMEGVKADADAIMTEEDYEALLDYRQEKAKGKLISSKQLKKALGA